MAGIAEKHTLLVTVVLQVANAVVAGKTRLGNHDVRNPIELLPRVKIVVRLEYSGDMVFQK